MIAATTFSASPQRGQTKGSTYWRVIPGSNDEGSIDGSALEKWVNDAQAICEASGRLEVSQTLIGQVLFHAPADSDGLWIDRSVAMVLDARNARRLREGG